MRSSTPKARVSALLATLVPVLTLLAAAPAGAGVIPYAIDRTTLDNGLKVMLVPMPSEGLVSYWTVVRTGSRDEVEEGVTGFAHFFEHMMFRGTEAFPADAYQEVVASMGADSNAFTSADLTGYYLSLTREDLAKAIEIESDRFQNLAYSEEDFRTEAGAVFGEYRKGRTSPFFVGFEALSNLAFEAHTYQHTTIGYEADIERMPEQFDYSKTFFDRFYRPENCVVVVVGDFDVEATRTLIGKAYGGWKPGYVAPKVPVEPPQTAQKRLEVPFEGQTLPILMVAFKGERFLPEDREMVAATLLGELAFGETSALYKKLVLDQQRVQNLGGDFGFQRDPGLWAVLALVTDPADVPAIEGEVWSTIDRFRSELVSSEQLDAVRSRLKYGFLSGLDTTQGVAGNLAQIIALTGDVTAVDALYATAAEVTPEDVRAAARRFLVPERSSVVTVHSAGSPIPEPKAAEEPVLLRVEQDPNVAFRLWFEAGSQNDPEGKEGLAALAAAMVAEGGTAARSYEEVLEALAPLAASYRARVDKEMTTLSGTVHRDLTDRFYGLFLEAVLTPGFRPEDFERLKARTVAGIEKQLRYSSDEELGKAALYGRVFAGTPYEHLAEGTVASVKALTLDDVKAFLASHYTRDNVVIALGGAYPEPLAGRLVADLARLPEGKPAPVPAPEPAPIEGRQVLLVEKPGASTAISFGYPVDVHRGSREFYALWIANSWLGEHRNSISHLYQVIRETRGMNYGDYSYIEVFPDGGRRNMPPTGVGRRQHLFEVWLRPVPHDRAVFAFRAALREIDQLIENGLTPEQVEAHKVFLSKYVLQFATSTPERLGYAVDDRYYGVEGEGHLARFRQMMEEITPEEVNAAIRKHLQTESFVLVMATADGAAMKEALVSGAPSPIDYGEVTKPAEVLAEDEEIESYPMKIEAEDVTVVPVEEMFER